MHSPGVRVQVSQRPWHGGGIFVNATRATGFPRWSVTWLLTFLVLWQAGRYIPHSDDIPYYLLVISSLAAGGIAFFTLLPAMAEIAQGVNKPWRLLAAAFISLIFFALTAVISRATYNQFEGLLVFNVFALVSAAATFGVWLSTEIEKPGHLLPVCIIAAGVDIISVARGPSSIVVEQISKHMEYIAAGLTHLPPYTSFLILRYPQPGQGLGLMLGVGDLAFFAVLAGSVIRMELPRINIPLLALWGYCALVVSIFLQVSIPALPFIGLGFVLWNIKRIKLNRAEMLITIVFSAALIIIGVVVMLI